MYRLIGSLQSNFRQIRLQQRGEIMELSKGKTRAAELLTAAAAHRTFVEHCLWKWDQHQTGHQLAGLAEVLEAEGWMTGEDAIEVACWHLQSTDTLWTRNLAPGKRPWTASHGMPLQPKPEAPRLSTHGKRPRAGTAPARLAGGERRFQPWNAMAESQGREGRAGVQQEFHRTLVK